MTRILARTAPLLILAIFLAACGDQSLFMSLKSDTSDIQINSATDGQVFAPGTSMPLLISGQASDKNSALEIEITLTSPADKASGISARQRR